MQFILGCNYWASNAGTEMWVNWNEEAIEKEKKLEKTVLALKDRFGKNSMLRAIDLEEGATAIERNKLIGGHNE